MNPKQKEEKAVEDWNNTVKIGDAVEYREVMPEGREVKPGSIYEAIQTTTRSEAFMLSGHTAVVQIKGKSGCVALSHCKAV